MNNKTQELRLIEWDNFPVSEDELDQIELQIGDLPEDYRSFLLKNNGGRPVDVVTFENYLFDSESLIRHFVGIQFKYPPKILKVTINDEGKDQKFELLPIVRLHDEVIFMKMNSPDLHFLYFWDYNLDDKWEAEEKGIEYLPTDNDLFFLEKTFTEFLETLKVVSHDDDDDPPGSFEEISGREKFESICRYGDLFFEQSKQYITLLKPSRLNKPFREGILPIHIAAGFGQIRIVKLLLELGANIDGVLEKSAGSLEIVKLLLENGSTYEDQQKGMSDLAWGMSATSDPEKNKIILDFLIDKGVVPDFDDTEVSEKWEACIHQIFTTRTLDYLSNTIPFPPKMKKQIQDRMQYLANCTEWE